MNQLLKLNFDKLGYTYEYLTELVSVKYDGKFLFKDEDKLILRLKDIRAKNLKIVILGDFDMDGISSTTILYSSLALFGFDVYMFVPDVNKGYGFDTEDIDRLIAENPGVSVILTCDVGIGCVEAISYAKSKDIEVLVTDHHPERVRTEADVIVDPSRMDETCEFKGICGAYVAYHLVRLYAQLTGNDAVISLISHMSLFASLGSVGDLMPLHHDTRNIVKAGLAEFNALCKCVDISEYFHCSVDLLPEAYVRPFQNLRSFHMYMIRTDVIKPGIIDEVSYGFRYCPMFNSVKRMGESMNHIYDLLFGKHDDDRSAEFLALEDWLVELNDQRKELVAECVSSFFLPGEIDFDMDAQPYAPFVMTINTRPGILGLLAMEVMKRTGLPSFVTSVVEIDGQLMCCGSGRLPLWFDPNLMNLDYVSIGGHDRAFGISFPYDRLDDLCKYLTDICDKYMEAQGNVDGYAEYFKTYPVIALDDIAIRDVPNWNAEDKNFDFRVKTIDDYDICYDCAYNTPEYGPYGPGFPEPLYLFCVRRKDIEAVRTMGEGKHLRVVMKHNITGVFFYGGNYFDTFEDCDPESVFLLLGSLNLNSFRGNTSLQLQIKNIL